MDSMEIIKDRLGYYMVYIIVDRLSKRPVSVTCHKMTVSAKEIACL